MQYDLQRKNLYLFIALQLTLEFTCQVKQVLLIFTCLDTKTTCHNKLFKYNNMQDWMKLNRIFFQVCKK